ncbi:MAG: PD40 domain-containing protein [Muribaculaceae bacterium]|nr:PD40 domain-containing protein [Muribaculaceae bacterium]
MKGKLLLTAALLLSCGSMLAQRPSSFSEPRLLLKADAGLMAPVWSPDGSQIAVTGDNFTGIFVANADGSAFRQVSDANGAGYKMTWNSANEIVSTPWTMVDQRRMTRVERVNVATGSITSMAAPERNFKRSRVMNGANSLLQIMVDDPINATRRIASLNAFEGKMVLNPTLSPDGKKIAFQIVGKGLMVCNTDGSDLKALGRGSHPCWMPDSHYIMAARIADNGDVFTQSDIFCIDTTTGAASCITPSTDAIPVTLAVSPDGKHIAFDNDTDGAIYVIDLNY